MAQSRGNDSGNPILNSPYEEPRAHYATDEAGVSDDSQIVKNQLAEKPMSIADDWNVPTAEEDEAVYRAFIRAQESSLRRFWEETKDDNL